MSLAKTYKFVSKEHNCAPLIAVTYLIQNITQRDNLEINILLITLQH